MERDAAAPRHVLLPEDEWRDPSHRQVVPADPCRFRDAPYVHIAVRADLLPSFGAAHGQLSEVRVAIGVRLLQQQLRSEGSAAMTCREHEIGETVLTDPRRCSVRAAQPTNWCVQLGVFNVEGRDAEQPADNPRRSSGRWRAGSVGLTRSSRGATAADDASSAVVSRDQCCAVQPSDTFGHANRPCRHIARHRTISRAATRRFADAAFTLMTHM